MTTSLVQFYYLVMLISWTQNLDMILLGVYAIFFDKCLKPFLSIYSRYAVEILLEILMPLHYGCAFRWPLATKIKWFA